MVDWGFWGSKKAWIAMGIGGLLIALGLVLMVLSREIGFTLALVGVFLVGAFGYYLAYHWNWMSPKPVEGTARSEVWFCPSCGNLDIQGAKSCPGCGKPLPEFIAIKNGVWAPDDSKDPHKVAIGKGGKEV
jgi:hypothetical protein